MRKKIIILIIIAVIFNTFDVSISKVYADSDPYLYVNYDESAYVGQYFSIIYTYNYVYDIEKIEFIIKNVGTNTVIESLSSECDNKKYNEKLYTLNINSSGYSAGRYSVTANVYYKENGVWKKSNKASSVAYFTLISTNSYSPNKEDFYNNSSNNNNSPNMNSSVYRSEYVNGKWYDKNGKYYSKSSITWHRDSVGWWMTNEKNWYPTDMWEKIDHKWYYFKPDGYMAENEWYNGYWFNSDGAWTYAPKLSWHRDSHGWWVQDTSGWYPRSKWQKIDGYWYYFNSSGYMVVNQYVDGYWLGIDGTYY